MKRKTILLLTILMIFSSVSFVDASRSPIDRKVKVFINDKEVPFLDQGPVIENDRVLVPVRVISKNLGFDVEWDQSSKSITLTKNIKHITHVINMKLDEMDVWTKKVDSKANEIYLLRTSFINYELDSPAKVINGRTLLPLRFVSEIIDCKVEWDKRTFKVIITKEDDNLEYLDVSYYNNRVKEKIKNEKLKNSILNAFIESEAGYLLILGNQMDVLYEEGNYIEINPDMNRVANITKLREKKLKKLILILEDVEIFKKGTILTWDDSGEARAWITNDNDFKKIIKDIGGKING